MLCVEGSEFFGPLIALTRPTSPGEMYAIWASPKRKLHIRRISCRKVCSSKVDLETCTSLIEDNLWFNRNEPVTTVTSTANDLSASSLSPESPSDRFVQDLSFFSSDWFLAVFEDEERTRMKYVAWGRKLNHSKLWLGMIGCILWFLSRELTRYWAVWRAGSSRISWNGSDIRQHFRMVAYFLLKICYLN